MEETIERRARGRAGAPRGGRSPRWHKAAAVFVSALLLVISAAVVRDRSALERSEHQVQLAGMTRETVTRITTVLASLSDLLGHMTEAHLFGDLNPVQFKCLLEDGGGLTGLNIGGGRGVM